MVTSEFNLIKMKIMKISRITALLASFALGAFCTSCHNAGIEFPDCDGGINVYFAKQYPLRTLEFGEDTYSTELDNQGKCAVYATMGGAYRGRDITLDIAVDNSLTDNLYFADGRKVLPMPSSYYSLSSDKIEFRGELQGFVEVSFTDAFFADPLTVGSNYVIPVMINNATGQVDSVLRGQVAVEGSHPARTDASGWNVLPKDYTLYCVNYISRYDAIYLRRGVDLITADGATTRKVRHAASVEKDEVIDASTVSREIITLPLDDCTITLSFNAGGDCSIGSATEGVSASGSGSYREKSEKKAWGNLDRDGLYLDYTLSYADGRTVATKDTLVFRNRGIIPNREFSVIYQE